MIGTNRRQRAHFRGLLWAVAMVAVFGFIIGANRLFARWSKDQNRSVLMAAPSNRILPSFGNASPDVLQGVAWQQWLQSQAATPVSAPLKKVLARSVAQWQKRGVPLTPFGVLRASASFTSDSIEGTLASGCYPFEKRHARGDAIDVWVGDVNGDARADLVDACLFARSLDEGEPAIQGGLGVYAQTGGTHGDAAWVHIDAGGKADRWGEAHAMKGGAARGDAIPIFWWKPGRSVGERSVRERCRAWGLDLRHDPLRVVVDKTPQALVFDESTQTMQLSPMLRLYAGKRLVKSYAVALGFDAVHAKEKRDDYRTPEGAYFVSDFNPQSRFHKSLRLSYPNAADAARGLRQGLIDAATYRRIVRAIAAKRTPPQDTPLGGDIMMHGGGGRREAWTWGCIALDNPDIDELFDLLPRGTSVEVRGVQP